MVLEGPEGAGKSTQVERLARWLEARGVPHVVSREPGGTPLGESIRELVLEREDLAPGPESELFLILAARAAFVREVVRPALEEGKVVLADRFDLSTFAYQGYGRGMDLERIREMNDFAIGGVRPDLYVVLDLSPEAGLRRQEDQGAAPDRMESEGRDFLRRVRAGYRDLASRWSSVELVDGGESEERVHRRIRDVLARRLGAPFREEPFAGSVG